MLRVNPSLPLEFDPAELEDQIVQSTLDWEDRLRLRLVEEFGDEHGEQYARELGPGFPPGYRDDFDPRVGVLDVKKILRLISGDELAMSLYRLVEEGDDYLPGHEELIGLRMQAHARAGDHAGVRQEWESYERVINADPWSDGEPAPKLVDVRRRLLDPAR